MGKVNIYCFHDWKKSNSNCIGVDYECARCGAECESYEIDDEKPERKIGYFYAK